MKQTIDEELLVVDHNDIPTDSMPRSAVLQTGSWHRAAGGIEIDLACGTILCHQRSANKDERPGLWVATFGGKSLKGEIPLETARRELQEEYGFDRAPSQFIFFDKYRSPVRHQYEYLYYVCVSQNIAVSPDPNEVNKIEWIHKDIVLTKIQHERGWFKYGYEMDLIASCFGP